MFGDVFYPFDHPDIFFDLQSFLGIVPEDHGITDVHLATVGLFNALEDVDEG